MALHTEAACADEEVLPGVFFASREAYLRQIVGQDSSLSPVRRLRRLGGGPVGKRVGCGRVAHHARDSPEDVFDEAPDLWRRIAPASAWKSWARPSGPGTFPEILP